jgi:hypothetical protein
MNLTEIKKSVCELVDDESFLLSGSLDRLAVCAFCCQPSTKIQAVSMGYFRWWVTGVRRPRWALVGLCTSHLNNSLGHREISEDNKHKVVQIAPERFIAEPREPIMKFFAVI